MIENIVTHVNWFILWYLIILNLVYVILMIASIPDILNSFKEVGFCNILTFTKSHSLPPVTVVVPAYNEEAIILDSVQSILNSDYPNLSVIIVNAGSIDNTLDKLIHAYCMKKVAPLIEQKIPTKGAILGYYVSDIYKNIVVIDQAREDRSDTLNVGVNAVRTPLYITVDADTLIEPDAVSRIVFYMITKSHTLAVGGGVYILNGCTIKEGRIIEAKMSLRPIYAFQTCEYLRSFLFSRCGWNAFGGGLCYAGAFTLFKHETAVEVGGYDYGNPAQDFEIITHIHAHRRERKEKYHISYTPAAIVWTDVPGSLKEYWVQRFKWQQGTLQSLLPYKKMFFNPKYGIVGFFTYPFFVFGEALGPLVEFLAYLSLIVCWFLGILDTYWAILFFIVCIGFSTVLTMVTTLLSFITFDRYKKLSDLFWILLYSVVENFGFRQFNVICRTSATIKYCFDKLFSIKNKGVTS